MRITQKAVALTSLQGLNRNLDTLGTLQNQLTSGRLINAPSDSPTGTNRAMQTRSEQAAVAQEARNITDAMSWMEQGGTTLQEGLIGLANTNIQGRPLFGGVTPDSKAYNPDGTFAGLAGAPTTRRIS